MDFLLLGLLGTALFGVFDLFGGDDSPEEEDVPPEGQELTYDGSDLLEGTEGNDTIPAGQDMTFAPDVINLLGGDDTAFIEVNDYMTISGGDGNDVITATGVVNTLEGDAGNDTLTADDSNRLFGGDGDDVLNFFHGSYDQGENGRIEGGDGDDIITVHADALVPAIIVNDVGGVSVSGGNGADEIDVIYGFTDTFDGGDGVVIGSGVETEYSGAFITIHDFDPSEDSLLVEVEAITNAEYEDIDVELDQTEQDDGTYKSRIKLTFEGTDELPDATNTLIVYSASPFTLDSIKLVGI